MLSSRYTAALLRELGNYYDYKLEDFHFHVRDNLMEPYQAVWKNINKH